MKKVLIQYRSVIGKWFLAICCGILLTYIFCSCGMMADNAVYAVVSENNLSKDGYYYTLYENNTAVITGMKDSGEEIAMIPSKLDSSYTVTAIGEGAFEGNEALKYVKLGEGIREVGQNAFRKCYRLLRVDLATTVTKVGNNSFESCERLCEVNGTSGLREIGDSAFYRCLSLSVIGLEEGLKTIGTESFLGCSALTQVILPKSLSSAGDAAFAQCTSVTRVNLGGLSEIPNSLFEKSTALLSVKIGNNVTHIGERAFKGSQKLESVTIGKKVRYIGDAAFEGTIWLSNQTDEFFVVGDGVLLKYNGSGPDVTIPKEVKVITDAFEGSERIQRVTIGSKVTRIAKYAFNGCVNLTDVVITAKVTEIESCAFLGCISLKTVELPATLRAIGNNVFNNCSSLKTVVYKGSSADWGKVTVGEKGNVALYSAKIVYEG
ncbi:MAG: leucine-rich repeat domain-containing protein [Clostridia bacterium]|nr:leucine-rich repeat domain-containing protein [Clostridia bacterium]